MLFISTLVAGFIPHLQVTPLVLLEGFIVRVTRCERSGQNQRIIGLIFIITLEIAETLGLPYGTRKNAYATIAKVKTMVHENVPISRVQYAMAMVT